MFNRPNCDRKSKAFWNIDRTVKSDSQDYPELKTLDIEINA